MERNEESIYTQVKDVLVDLKNVKESLLSCLVYLVTGDIKDEEVSISCQKKLANSVAALEGLSAQLEDSLGVTQNTQN